MVSKERAKDIKATELYRHGDGAVAMILGWFASLHLSSPIEFIALPSASELEVNHDDYDGWFSELGVFSLLLYIQSIVNIYSPINEIISKYNNLLIILKAVVVTI
ncbi:hypothetical protein KPC_0643 [Acinetobacter stercoris]|uniref:Uncharacterized protein n=1 Tax=Acinetobacter stercoris TaxID=2126983 RepID=A0A2U3MVR0_9GAMM|nr:hypothetical protein KPC_0643 [Acinetobacter stercoris]